MAELEAPVAHEVLDVLGAGRQEVVHADDFVVRLKQPFTQMGAEKPGPTRHYRTHAGPLGRLAQAVARASFGVIAEA
ncbi:hypothetical protein GCM10010103_38940 [Streptomyces paradoxus]